MKRNSLSSFPALAAAAFLCSTAVARAQDQGVFRFANAAALEARVFLTVDNAKLRPDGFGPGDTTGAIGILAGAHRLTAAVEKGKPAETPFNVQPGSSTTIIAFSKPVVDPQTKQTVQQLQLVALPDPPRGKGKSFRVVYASAKPGLEIMLNGQPLHLNAMQESRTGEAARGAIKIEAAGKPVLNFTAEESGSFLAIIFDKADGSLGGMLLPDYG